jgi:hypothetical protein
MIVSGVAMILLYADNIFSLFKILLSWTFAVASYKIFVEDLTIARLKDRKIEPMADVRKNLNEVANGTKNVLKESLNDFRSLGKDFVDDLFSSEKSCKNCKFNKFCNKEEKQKGTCKDFVERLTTQK